MLNDFRYYVVMNCTIQPNGRFLKWLIADRDNHDKHIGEQFETHKLAQTRADQLNRDAK